MATGSLIGFVGQNNIYVPKLTLKPQPKNPPDITEKSNTLAKKDVNNVDSQLLKSNITYTTINGKSIKLPPNVGIGKLKNEISDYKIDDQGDTNSCGTTSLTSVLKHYGSKIKDHWEIDKSIRSARFDMFTTPGDIVSFAIKSGFRAGMKNNGDFDELAKYTDKGVPVMILMDPDQKTDFGLHWMVVTGYERGMAGTIDSLKIANPAGGYLYTEKTNEFNAKWSDLRVGFEKTPVIGGKSTFSTGYNRLMIPIVPKDKMIKTPDGKLLDANKINIPNDTDSIQGKGARVVGKGAIFADKTIGLGEKISVLFKGNKG